VRVHLCGVRGSTPAPGRDFLRYGGHTSCVAVCHDDGPPRLILDAGTGLRPASALLRGEAFSGTILLTHLHWDHVHGLPFFAAGDRPDAQVRLLLPEQDSTERDRAPSAEDVLARGMSPPHFPITPGQLRGQWSFGFLAPGEVKAEGFAVEAAEIPHKGGRTFGYRISDGHSVLAYLPDHCPTDLGPGPEGWGEYHPAALALAAGADALVHDAFLLPDEVPAQAFLGHAAADYAVGLGRRAGSRRVILSHHKPDRTDQALDLLAARFAADPHVIVAAEGTVIDL